MITLPYTGKAAKLKLFIAIRESIALLRIGKHLIQALPSVYALQCLTGKEDKNRIE